MTGQATTMPQAKIVDAKTLNALLNVEKPIMVMDVRPPEHFAVRHIPGAHNHCVYEVVFLDSVRQALPDTEVTIALYSASHRCLAASDAAAKLLRAGYAYIIICQDGLEGWFEAGFPLEGTLGPEPSDALVLEVGGQHLTVDLKESRIEWTGRNRTGRHFGSVALSEGELLFRDDRFAHGMFVIDMESLKDEDLKDLSLSSLLIAHLKSVDFFLVDQHPEASFETTATIPVPGHFPGMANYSVEGKLTLRGVTRELRFPATVERLDDGRLTLEAHFDLDRTRWGASYGSGKLFEKLGMHLVHDMVSIQLRLVTLPPATRTSA